MWWLSPTWTPQVNRQSSSTSLPSSHLNPNLLGIRQWVGRRVGRRGKARRPGALTSWTCARRGVRHGSQPQLQCRLHLHARVMRLLPHHAGQAPIPQAHSHPPSSCSKADVFRCPRAPPLVRRGARAVPPHRLRGQLHLHHIVVASSSTHAPFSPPLATAKLLIGC